MFVRTMMIALMALATPAQADPNTWKHAGVGWITAKLIKERSGRKRPDLSALEIEMRACLGAAAVGGLGELAQFASGAGVADLRDVGAATVLGCTGLLPDPLPQVVDASVAIYAASAIIPAFGAAVAYVEYIKAFHPERIEHIDTIVLQEETRLGFGH